MTRTRETRNIYTILVGNLLIKFYVKRRKNRWVGNIKTYFVNRGSRSGPCPLTGNCIDFELPVSDTSVDYLISQLILDSADPKLYQFAEHLWKNMTFYFLPLFHFGTILRGVTDK